jgi:D-glycero-alpha-D-manno-heptose 1-phosphate guanylyltransferase
LEAIILAGGFGTRLRSVVSDIPKSMARVGDRPFLEYLMDYLIAQGIERVVLSVGYRREAIMNHFKNRYRSLELDYAVEEEPLGTGGGIRLSFFKVRSPWAFVLNGDSIFRIGLEPLREFHEMKRADISIALRKLPDTGRFGRVTLNRSRRITGFSEKDPSAGRGLINSGVYVVNKNFLMDPSFRGAFSIEKDCFEKMYAGARFYGYPLEGYFLDIGIPEDYKKAQDDFKGFGD